MRPASASPSIWRTSSARTAPAAWEIAWSSSESASRTEPSAARAISASASGSAVTPSLARMPSRWATSTPASTRRRSNRWQRDSTVTGTLPISVVANTNLAWGGGSSRVFSSALKAAVREHVHFVEDVDLVARAHRRVTHGVVDLADVVDAVVGGGVHLQHVDVPAFHDRLAIEAEHRHLDGRRGHRAVRQFVVQAAGEDAGGRGLADAAHAGEDPGLRDAPGLERVRDRPHHGLLADQVVEGGGPVFAREHPVARARRGAQSQPPAEPAVAALRARSRPGSARRPAVSASLMVTPAAAGLASVLASQIRREQA